MILINNIFLNFAFEFKKKIKRREYLFLVKKNKQNIDLFSSYPERCRRYLSNPTKYNYRALIQNILFLINTEEF